MAAIMAERSAVFWGVERLLLVKAARHAVENTLEALAWSQALFVLELLSARRLAWLEMRPKIK